MRNRADHLPKPKKGERTPGSGRKPGQQNRATIELKKVLADLVHDPEYQDSLIERAKAGKLAPALELGIVHLVIGKPVDRLEQGKPGDFKTWTDDQIREMLAGMALKLDAPEPVNNRSEAGEDHESDGSREGARVASGEAGAEGVGDAGVSGSDEPGGKPDAVH